MSMTDKTLPDLVPDAELHLPRESERTLSNGLTVIAIRRSAVPLVEVRLRIPFGRAPLAPATLLSQALFTGTSDLSSIGIAAELQAVGGSLSAGLDPDRLLISGNALADGLDRTLELLAAVLTDATYPVEEVSTERERLTDHIQVALSQPSHLARVALLKRMYGAHPYAVQTPDPARSVPSTRSRCASCTPPGSARPARPWCWSATSTRTRPSTPRRRSSAAGPAAPRTAASRPLRRSPPARCCSSTVPARCSPRCGSRCPR